MIVFAIAYQMAVPQANFKCPFSIAQNCSNDSILCTSCKPVDTTARRIAEVLQMPTCSSNPVFTDYDSNLDQETQELDSCEESLESSTSFALQASGLRTRRQPATRWCSLCTQRSAIEDLPIYLSMVIFPLSVVFMACSLSAWRRCSVRSGQGYQSLEQKLARILDLCKIGNVFLKYTFESVLFFVLVGFDGPTPGLRCKQFEKFGANAVFDQCNPVVDRRNAIFVLACCCVSFFGILVFDVATISRNKFMDFKFEISSGLLLCCFFVFLVSALQLLRISNLETTFTCGSKFFDTLQTFGCDRKRRESETGISCDCSFSLPIAAQSAAAALALDVVAFSFKAASNTFAGKREQSVVPDDNGLPLKIL